MKLEDIIDHCAYDHRRLGLVWIVGRHPHDGAAIIVSYHNEDEDEEEYHLCVSEDFVSLVTGDEGKPIHGRAFEHWTAARNPATADRRRMSPEFISAVQNAIIACRMKGFKPGPVPTVNTIASTAKTLWTSPTVACASGADGINKVVDNPHFEGGNTASILESFIAWGWKP